MRFTAEEAFEATESGEPILLSKLAAERIVRGHDVDMDGFDDLFKNEDRVDATDLLHWLGY